MSPNEQTVPPTLPTAGVSAPMLLVVDDEPAILELLTDVLTDEGYTVLTAADGKLALETMHQAPIVLVLTDYMMPHLNGVELCMRLRAEPGTAHIPIIMMSAAPPPDVHSFSALIHKPFIIDHVVEQIKKHQRPVEPKAD